MAGWEKRRRSKFDILECVVTLGRFVYGFNTVKEYNGVADLFTRFDFWACSLGFLYIFNYSYRGNQSHDGFLFFFLDASSFLNGYCHFIMKLRAHEPGYLEKLKTSSNQAWLMQNASPFNSTPLRPKNHRPHHPSLPSSY